MKKLLMFTSLVCAALGFLSAQNPAPPLYEANTLSGFREWRFANSGEKKNFEIPVLFSSAGGITFKFIDSELKEQLDFESEFPWPPMRSGQGVTIYFSAWGPWIWDRRLEAIDYGDGRLVQVQAERPSAAANPEGSGADSPGGDTGGRAGNERSPDSGVPATNSSPAELDTPRKAPAEGAFDYGKQPVVTPPPPSQIIVRISGNTPQPGRYYRLQIGSFSVPGNATRVVNSLKEAGLDPAFEEFQNKVRVVLAHVPGEDVVEVVRKIGNVGFPQVWCREEP
ncbi:MAG: SPOR domain-containing protein [Treponema sp.]|jgi:hypothetical protein|nr:SPOR domain-containing protein [Treponema sp.]